MKKKDCKLLESFSFQGIEASSTLLIASRWYLFWKSASQGAVSCFAWFLNLSLLTCRENPELYLEQLRSKYRELSEKVEQRKRLKTNGGNTNGNNNGTGGVGRGERLNASQKERMRLLTTAAFDRGKGEDTFGIKDEDWQLYKLMSKDHDDDDEGPDEDEAELARMSARLKVSHSLCIYLAKSTRFAGILF